MKIVIATGRMAEYFKKHEEDKENKCITGSSWGYFVQMEWLERKDGNGHVQQSQMDKPIAISVTRQLNLISKLCHKFYCMEEVKQIEKRYHADSRLKKVSTLYKRFLRKHTVHQRRYIIVMRHAMTSNVSRKDPRFFFFGFFKAVVCYVGWNRALFQ